ncbi:hypothetical protein JYJ95_37855 [Corallococcus exiguus]|uniref:hypothetical protein n=1 Tax=Corallococcus exiguus TaxID=83462 RepID=UPI001A8DE23C|nr:hypothetical protein [Corallococcus exiguus]MBN8472302.1 hypothetical protein [Corallococcus exiguus]
MDEIVPGQCTKCGKSFGEYAPPGFDRTLNAGIRLSADVTNPATGAPEEKGFFACVDCASKFESSEAQQQYVREIYAKLTGVK